MYLMDNGMEVAKAMIQAGIQAAAAIMEQEQGEADAEPDADAPRVLH